MKSSNINMTITGTDAGDCLLRLALEREKFFKEDGLRSEGKVVYLNGTIEKSKYCDNLSFFIVLVLNRYWMHLETGDFLHLSIQNFELFLIKQASFLKTEGINRSI